MLALCGIAALVGFVVLRNLNGDSSGSETRTVYVERADSGFRLIRNGEPFVIRGAGGDSYFKELAEIGGNTIRLFNTTDLKEKLEEAHRHGLAVIVDIYIPPYSASNNVYGDEREVIFLKKRVKDLVDEHKGHPALLFWNLGNELKYPFVFRKNDFIRVFNELLSTIQQVDPNHPVSTTIIGAGRKTMISIFLHSPELDIIGFNTFGNTKFVNKNVSQLSFLFGEKPYYLSEIGPDGPWETSTTSWGAPIEATTSRKSEHYRSRSIMVESGKGTANLGSLLFYWGEKLERSHTWFSLFRNGERSKSIQAIEAMWNSSVSSLEEDGLNYMLVNWKGAQDNIVLYPGEPARAELLFHEPMKDHVRIEWEIYPESWYGESDELVVDTYVPIDTFVGFEANSTAFLAPVNEGPYRIFAYIYSGDGSFVTTNTPFYVMENR